jgi:nitrogenase molybdenum-cofactor synthesis protein NifE
MAIVMDSAPVPSDYFGVLWALAGIKNALILEHGATGTAFYNAVTFNVMNKQSPKGILFTTGLDEDDVVMGREEKIVRAVEELDGRYRPRIISLAATAVTSVIGLDLEGLRRELQPRVNAKLLAFSGGGFLGDYTVGIKEVFRTLVDEVVGEVPGKRARAVNLIGPTIDTFNHPSDYAEIKRLLGLVGVEVRTVFTQCTDVAHLESLSTAALNIVTRDIGLEAAQRLQQRFGTPYYCGLPFGLKASVRFLEQIAETLGLSMPRDVISSELRRYGYTLSELTSWWHRYEHLRVVVSCPYDYAMGLTRFVQEEWGLTVKAVVLPTPPQDPQAVEAFKALGVEKTWVAPGEEKLRDILAAVKPHILFGSSCDFRLAPQVPIRIHAAMPAFDHLYLFDGTPFVGFRGSLYLTQTLINALNSSREVWKS